MKTLKTLPVVAFVVVTGLAVISCSREAQPPPAQTSAPTQTTAPAQTAAVPAAAPVGTVIASEQFAGDPNLRCDLLEVKRVSGGAVRIKWRLVNTGGKDIYYDFRWDDLYYIDPAENKKYGFLTDSEGNRILDVFYGTFKAGDQKQNWAKFPEPPPTSTKISVAIPKFPPFEDVPVGQ